MRGEDIIPVDAPRPTFASQCKSLTQAKKTNPDLKEAHSQMLQQVLRRQEKAFVGMYEQSKGLPRSKKPGRIRFLLFHQLSVNPIQGNKVKLSGVGWVKMRLSRSIPEGVIAKQAQIVKRASLWYVMLTLQADVEVPDPIPHGRSVGIDLRITSFLATSTGELIYRPKFFVDLQRKLRLLQQRVSKKKLGSNNRHKAQNQVAKLYEHIHNKRQDFHLKLAHQLCEGVGMIFAEKLNIKGLSRGMLGKHCSDPGCGQFLTVLAWVCWKSGVSTNLFG